MFVDATAARGSSSQCGAKNGVAAESPRTGPSGAQVPVRQRSAVLLRANGRCQRRLCPAARVTYRFPQRENLVSITSYQGDFVEPNEWKGLASLREDHRGGENLFSRKRIKLKNLLSIPFREERKKFFNGGKENTQLALSSSKFLCVCLIRAREAETVFALRLWHWDTPPHRLVLVRRRTDLFSAFVCGSCFSTHHHRCYCGIYQRRALPTEWCLSWGED